MSISGGPGRLNVERKPLEMPGLQSSTVKWRDVLDQQVTIHTSKPRTYWRDVLKSLENRTTKASLDLYTFLLVSCSRVRALPEGRRVHAHIVDSGMETCISLGDRVAQMYVQCGSPEDAEKIMRTLDITDWTLWCALITGYIHQRKYSAAMNVFQRVMASVDIAAQKNETFYSEILAQLASPGVLQFARMVHSYAVKDGMDPGLRVGTALVKMYVRCGATVEARKVFDIMKEKSPLSWTVMMSAYVRNGDIGEALHLLRQSLLEGFKPNEITFTVALKACTTPAALSEGTQIHRLVKEARLEELTPVSMALIKMYGKCGSLSEAQRVLDRMKHRDVAAWTVMIACYSHYRKLDKAFELLKKMDLEGDTPNAVTFLTILRACTSPEALAVGKLIHKCVLDQELDSDVAVGTGLVNMYAKWGRPDEAHKAFVRMETHDVSSWNCLLAAYSQTGQGHRALHLYKEMQLQGYKPDGLTLTTVMDACTWLKALEEGSRIHEQLSNSGFRADYILETALITFYGKCGRLETALSIFETLSFRDTVTWSTLIGLYHEQGTHETAVWLFSLMLQEGMKPGRGTLLTLLNVCNSVAEAELVHSCVKESGLEVDLELSNTLVTTYGRCGDVEAALSIFQNIQQKDVISWTALIGVYTGNQLELEALNVFKRMQAESKFEPSSVTFILALNSCRTLAQGTLVRSVIPHALLAEDDFLQTALVNMYARCGCLENARLAFDEMKSKDTVLWSTMIAACAQHGCNTEVLKLFEKMQQEGAKPDSITFVSVLSACSHAGLLETGLQYFVSIKRDYGLDHTLAQYGSVIDLMCRAGQLREAKLLVMSSEFVTSPVLWKTLLGATKVPDDAPIGNEAGARVLDLDPNSATAHVMLSNLKVQN